MFDALSNLMDFLMLRRPSLTRCVKHKDRVSYPPGSPVRKYRKGTLFVMLPTNDPSWHVAHSAAQQEEIDPETERALQRALDRVFPTIGPGDSDE